MKELIASYNQEYFGFEYSDGYTPIKELVDNIWDKNEGTQILTWGYREGWDGKHFGGRYIDDRSQLEDRLAGGRSIEDVRVYRVTDTSDAPSIIHKGDIITFLTHHDGTNAYIFRGSKRKTKEKTTEGFEKQFDKSKALIL